MIILLLLCFYPSLIKKLFILVLIQQQDRCHMSGSFFGQFAAIFVKNIRVHLRSRAILKQLGNLVIMLVVIIVLDKAGGQGVVGQIPFYMTIAIMLFCRGVGLTWVGERQSKQAEVQKIMGLSNAAYYCAWMLFYIINGLFLSVIFIGVLEAAGIFNDMGISFPIILLLYFLYLVCSFSFVLFLSVFFSDAMLASQVITFVQLIGSTLYFLLYIPSFRNSNVALGVTSILPAVCFEYTITTIGLQNNNNFYQIPWTENQGYITMGALTGIYFILFLYLSLVLPNQNGNNLHPLFFIRCFFEKKNAEQFDEKMELLNLSSARYYQETREHKKISMYLKNLTKSFDDKLIVNQLSLSLFQGEIFCLLGHNGAGKTTTINMLTGILQPDSGTINICGLDYYTQMNTIRSKTGVCLQIDVLYDQLTVRDHVEYYGKIKGIPKDQFEEKVDEIIAKCGLEDEQKKRTSDLSGGNKRKTCLACASIGNSQLLFLDEPSSGLDPSSRKVIWTLIDELRKEGRTIILTTHHLQQAEFLANRIGILAHGQMLVQGSCHYIRERYSCGYYLYVALDAEKEGLQAQKAEIRLKAKELIANHIEDDQMNEFTVKLLLPFNQQQHYAALFAFLEEKEYKFSLKISSLQDIFVKIGLQIQSTNSEPIPQIQKVRIPQFQPTFNFWSQFSHIFVKKFRTTVRSASVFFSVCLPILFIVIGIIIAILTNPYSNNFIINAAQTWSQFFLIANFMVLAFSFNTASYCGAIVKQREIKFGYLCYVMGMKKSAYWLATISYDVLMFCIPFCFIFFTIGCFPSNEIATLVHSYGWILLTLVLFACSFLPFTYLWSFAFTSSSSAYRFYPFLVYLFFFVIPSIPLFIVPYSVALQYLLPVISPLMALTACMMSEQMLGYANTQILIKFAPYINQEYFVQLEIWFPLAMLGVQCVVFFILVMIIDNFKFNLRDRQKMEDSQRTIKQSDDLKKEKEKIKNLKETKPIVIDSLFKKYPNGYAAIRDNSFIIEKGQTFGLLGPNGAGKSTTFNILTAAIPKTDGRVMLNGKEVNRAVDEIFTAVGVCPQFNPLYDQLTTAQHIEFFAGIKGLSGVEQKLITDFYIKHLALQEYRDVRSKKLSGGNKRKLCVAMALVGNPALVFLDEPSAGVDPISRRFLWNVLHSSAEERKRSIVLTTHSINEAESLCDRIGILIKGQFYCIDTPMQLKQRYGRGYRATLRCDSAQKLATVRSEVEKQFTGYKEETFEEQLKICFEFAKEGFVFSKIFGVFYNGMVKEGLIFQFEISETTLEQVFIYLSKMQGEEEVQADSGQSGSCCCWERTSQGCFCIC